MNAAQNTPKIHPYRQPHPPIAHIKAGHWYQYINRYWQRYLSGSELKLLLYILDAQLGWESNKAQPKWISRKNFANGITRKTDGTVFHAGTGLADSTIDKGLAKLEKRGVITVRRKRILDQIQCWYCINWSWKPWDEGVSEPAPRNSGGATRNPGNPMPDNRGQRESKGEIVSVSDSHPLPQNIEEKQKDEKEKGEPDKDYESIKADLLDPNPFPPKLERIWNVALAETFPTYVVVAWAGKERALVRNFGIRYNQASNRKTTFGQFIDWVVRNWQYIMATKFNALRMAPAYPRVEFLCAHKYRFLEMWAQEEELSTMSWRERAIRRLMQKGAPRDAAEEMIDRESALEEQKAEIVAERVRLQRAARIFEQERRRDAYIRANQNWGKRHIAPEKSHVIDPTTVDLSYIPESFPPFKETEE